MTKFEYSRLVNEVLKMAGENSPGHQIHAKAVEAKTAMLQIVAEMQRGINVLDGIVPYLAPDLPWEIGWVQPAPSIQKASSVKPVVSRTERVLSIVGRTEASGSTSIQTEDVAAELQAKGDTAPTPDLSTAAGNILTRTGRWRRTAPGQYELIKALEERAGGGAE